MLTSIPALEKPNAPLIPSVSPSADAGGGGAPLADGAHTPPDPSEPSPSPLRAHLQAAGEEIGALAAALKDRLRRRAEMDPPGPSSTNAAQGAGEGPLSIGLGLETSPPQSGAAMLGQARSIIAHLAGAGGAALAIAAPKGKRAARAAASFEPSDWLLRKPMSPFAEAVRMLRTTLAYADIDRRPKLIAITSALPGEGKTTLSMSLARIAALAGQKVLVIDGDLRRRDLSQRFAPDVPYGLLQALSGEVSWLEVVVEDPESEVDLLPAAAASFTPKDVFGSDAMGRLLQEARSLYDLVICDCAPVLAVAETQILAQRADKTVLVARWGKTPAKAARAALRLLASAEVDLAGVALNAVDVRSAVGGYYDTRYYARRYANYYSG